LNFLRRLFYFFGAEKATLEDQVTDNTTGLIRKAAANPLQDFLPLLIP